MRKQLDAFHDHDPQVKFESLWCLFDSTSAVERNPIIRIKMV